MDLTQSYEVTVWEDFLNKSSTDYGPNIYNVMDYVSSSATFEPILKIENEHDNLNYFTLNFDYDNTTIVKDSQLYYFVNINPLIPKTATRKKYRGIIEVLSLEEVDTNTSSNVKIYFNAPFANNYSQFCADNEIDENTTITSWTPCFSGNSAASGQVYSCELTTVLPSTNVSYGVMTRIFIPPHSHYKGTIRLSLQEYEAPFNGDNFTYTPYNPYHQYYDEKLVATIGSSLSKNVINIFNPVLTENVNGSSTFSFSLVSHYYDELTGELVINPFLSLLDNESKIRLKYNKRGKTLWYDFLIKNIEEDSSNHVFNYTCTNAQIQELAKVGFNIELSSDLENNQGTIIELANEILKETDWKVDEENSDLIHQYIEEPLYKCLVGKQITAKNMLDQQKTLTLNTGDIIYVFYSILQNQNTYFQFLKPQSLELDLENNTLLIDKDNYFIENIEYIENDAYDFNIPSFLTSCEIQPSLHGERLARTQKNTYDATLDEYVNIYQDSTGKEYYGYTDTEFVSDVLVNNLITNPNNFVNSDGWRVYQTSTASHSGMSGNIYVSLYPINFDEVWLEHKSLDDSDLITLLRTTISFNDNSSDLIYNSGILDYRAALNGFSEGEEYIFRYVPAVMNNANLSMYSGLYYPNLGARYNYVIDNAYGFDIYIAEYELDSNGLPTFNKSQNSQDVIVRFERTVQLDDNENYIATNVDTSKEAVEVNCFGYKRKLYWYEMRGKVERSISFKELITKNIGIFFYYKGYNYGGSSQDIYFYDAQFFPYKTQIIVDGNDVKTQVIYPEDVVETATNTLYYIYDPNSTENQKAEDAEDIVFKYKGYLDFESQGYIPVYDNNFEKNRSITASESNCFNLIQDLCETFQCWAQFNVERDPNTGKILVDENYKQKKSIAFKEYIGKDNYSGFKYGINLNSIVRNVDSDSIVTKMIVKNNSNEFAEDGFCSIMRAEDNPSGENFIVNFNYYINQGQLDFDEFNNDLYLTNAGYLGYYTKMRRLNDQRDKLIQEISDLSTTIDKVTSNVQVYSLAAEQAAILRDEAKQDLITLTGADYDTFKQLSSSNINNNLVSWLENSSCQEFLMKIEQYQKAYIENNRNLQKAQSSLTKYVQSYDSKTQILDTLGSIKEQLNREFLSKYSKYVQEGSWISEDYIDDNLYYLDAVSICQTSAFPQVNYTINVVDIASLEGYENYSFEIGDKTFVEDTEFFGWITDENGLKSPYKEEVIISEYINNLDSPESNTITVQNYKTQFEDLFQRLNATSQQIQYNSGSYDRAAGVVNTDGSISQDAIQGSLVDGSYIISNSKDQSVIWDETGITITNLRRPNEITKLTSLGILLSSTGGSSWGVAISGGGIDANYIKVGQLDASQVNIVTGDRTAFRWDAHGLNAFGKIEDDGTYSWSKYVRFDEYGIYGIDGEPTGYNYAPESAEAIKLNKYAKFGLTWDGFFLRSNHPELKNTNGESGYISISSDEDFQVIDQNSQERIKIGLLSYYIDDDDSTLKGTYGIRLRNSTGGTVLESNTFGELNLNGIISIYPEELNSESSTGYTDNKPRAQLGVIKKYTDNGNVSYSKIFEVKGEDGKENIEIFDNGLLRAKNAEIEGNITATDGIFRGTVYATDGEFNGIIYATDGKFTGIIEANGGYLKNLDISGLLSIGNDINGIKINGDGENQGIYSSNYNPENGTGFYLSTNGYIYANSLRIGTSAEIEEYIKLGNCYVINPIATNTDTNEDGEKDSLLIDGLGVDITGDFLDVLGQDGDDTFIFSPNAVSNNDELYKEFLCKYIQMSSEGFIQIGGYKSNGIKLDGKNSVIYVGNTTNDDSLAGIIIDGPNECIRTNSYTETNNLGWYIDDNWAILNNIRARGVLECTTFKYSEIQTVNGIIVLRPSSIIKFVSTASGDLNYSTTSGTVSVKVTLENGNGFNYNDYCMIRQSNSIQPDTGTTVEYAPSMTEKQILLNNYIARISTTITNVNNDGYGDKDSTGTSTLSEETLDSYLNTQLKTSENITLLDGVSLTLEFLASDVGISLEQTEEEILAEIEKFANSLRELTIIDFGQDSKISSNSVNPYGIALNATANNSFVTPRSLSIFKTSVNTENGRNIAINNVLILGQLPTVGLPENIRGNFGLYAETAFIKGAIISEKDGSNFIRTSTGMNTKSEIDMVFPDNIILNNTSGKVIIWGGAKWNDNLNDYDISNAPFRLDSEGNLYAQNGVFEDSIFAGATIESSVIRTSTIIGTGLNNNKEVGLIIRDVDHAISFRNFIGDNENAAYNKDDYESYLDITTDGILLHKGDVVLGSLNSSNSSISSIITNSGIIGIQSNSSGINSSIWLSTNRITFSNIWQEQIITGQPFALGYLEYNNGLNLGLGSSSNLAIQTSGTVSMNGLLNVNIQREIYMEENVQIKKVDDGYDLYILEE